MFQGKSFTYQYKRLIHVCLSAGPRTWQLMFLLLLGCLESIRNQDKALLTKHKRYYTWVFIRNILVQDDLEGAEFVACVECSKKSFFYWNWSWFDYPELTNHVTKHTFPWGFFSKAAVCRLKYTIYMYVVCLLIFNDVIDHPLFLCWRYVYVCIDL